MGTDQNQPIGFPLSWAHHGEIPSQGKKGAARGDRCPQRTVDQDFAEKQLTVLPEIRDFARANRAFLGLAVRFTVAQGIRQFVDIGSGLPIQGNVHEVADEMAPGGCRVVYIDNEPIAQAHAQIFLEEIADPNRHATHSHEESPSNPGRFNGPWKTAHERLRKWTADGTWDRILEHVIVKDDSLGTLEDNVEFVVSVDSTNVRAHQHAAGARKKGAARTGSKTSPSRANASGAFEAN